MPKELPTVDLEKEKINFEREKWTKELDLRYRELAIKKGEFKLKKEELRRSRWLSPFVLALGAATIAALSNGVVAWVNGTAQRQLEGLKAESARILEMIKTPDQEQTKKNLDFLLKAGLIEDEARKQKLEAFLRHTAPADFPSTAVQENSDIVAEGDWLLLESRQVPGQLSEMSNSALHLDVHDGIRGTLTFENTNLKASIFGVYRYGTLSLNYASSDPRQAGSGAMVFRALPMSTGTLSFRGYVMGLDYSTRALLKCPAVLVRKTVGSEEATRLLPKEPCELTSLQPQPNSFGKN